MALFVWAALARRFAPTSNTALTRFDSIVVLGEPADSDGNPTPLELSSVTEAVREYERGVAPRLIFTGAAVHNQYVEARVMAHAAEAQGIPSSAVLIEPRARNTFENACYSVRLMRARGWSSAEVIASPTHGPRAATIFSHLPIEWRLHPAPPLDPASPYSAAVTSAIANLKMVYYLVWEQNFYRCQP